MGIPRICCEKCGHVYSVEIREAVNERGQRESYLFIDPSHVCLGGYEMRLDMPEDDNG